MLETLTPATSFDLTTLAAARAELGGAAGIADPDLAALIRQASAACARACNRPHFAREQYAETAPLLGPFILARDLAVTLESIDAAGTVLDLADWQLEDGMLSRRGVGCEAWAWRYTYPLTVKYSAGYELPAEVPPDLEAACLMTLRARHYGRGRDPTIRSMSSEGIGMTQFAAVPVGASGMPQDAAGMLAPWRRLPGF